MIELLNDEPTLLNSLSERMIIMLCSNIVRCICCCLAWLLLLLLFYTVRHDCFSFFLCSSDMI